MIRRHPNLLPLLTLLGAWALFFWRFAVPAPGDRVTYPAGDFTQQFGVFRDVAYRALIAGRLPLWANCLYFGYPFHADPQAQVFYPPMWLTFGVLRWQGWGNFPIQALVAEVSAHYLFLSLFLFLFLRSLALRPWAASLGALIFTYGGYLTGYPPLQTAVLEVNLWLPLALLALVVSFALAVLAALGADALLGLLTQPARQALSRLPRMVGLLFVRLIGHAGCAYGYQAIEGMTPYQIATYNRFLERGPEFVRWELLGVKYVVTWRGQLFTPDGQLIPSEVVARGDVPDSKGNITYTHRLNLTPRRAFLVHRVEILPDDGALYARLADPGFDPFSIALLLHAIDVGPGGDGNRVSITHDAAGRIGLSAISDGHTVLVVSKAYFPGWRVMVDGRPAPLLRVDGALLAVRMPSGAYEIEFAYRPAMLALGGVISGLALLLVLGLGVADVRFVRKLIS